MADPTRLPPRPRPQRVDILSDGEDVSHVVDRDLVLRAVNSSLATEVALGKLAGEVGELTKSVDRLNKSRDSIRPKVDSFAEDHEYIAQQKEFARTRRKAAGKLLMAALLGAATAIGGVVGLGAIRDCAPHTATGK